MEKKTKVHIPKRWLSGDYDLFGIEDSFLHSLGNLVISNEREKLVRKLEESGYQIVTENSEIDADTICLVGDPTIICEDPHDTIKYKRLYDQTMFANGGEDLYYPTTRSCSDFFQRPFFPAVFKNEYKNGGVDKFLITSNEQLQKIKMFFLESTRRNPLNALAWEHVIFQQLIQTPTEYATYMRVLVAGSGEVLGSSLKVSRQMPKSVTFDGIFERIFLRPDSPFYLGAKKMFNYYSGGQSISLECPGNLDAEQRRILEAHGLDPDNLKVPDEILSVCRNLMLKCNKELGVICGFDFILNKFDGHWYYLENQTSPALDEWAIAKGIKPIEHTDYESYLRILIMENYTRLEALEMTKKKREELKKQSI